MPAVPVMPSYAALNTWPLWQNGRISAANVTWSVDASDSAAQQNYLLSTLAVAKGYNAIRLVLSAGSSESAWDDMYSIAVNGWGSSVTLVNGGQPISEIGDHITEILEKCANLGLGVILDCHDFYQRDWVDAGVTKTGPLWTGTSASGHTAADLRDKLVLFWQKTVTKWKAADYPAIIGYEILNEPNPDNTKTFAQMQAGTDNCWSKLATRCIQEIRKIDADTPIIVDGIYYADPYGLKYFDPQYSGSEGGAGLLQDYQLGGVSVKSSFADYRLVYSFHVYGPYEVTHQGVVDETYESQGLAYPLNYVPPYPLGEYANAARMRVTVYDGSATAATTNGSTSHAIFLPFITAADLVARNQPGLDFKTHAATAQGGVAVPIFVGEFSMVNPALIQSTRIATTNARRAITKIEVNSSGLATITLGNLSSGFNINIYPQYGNSTGPGWGGAYSDFARALVSNATNSAYDQTTAYMVRLEQGNNKIEPRILDSTTTLAVRYTDSSLFGQMLYNGGAQVATLTLKPGAYAVQGLDQCRGKYLQDVLLMCLNNGLSWAYWQEDGYVTTTSTIDSLDLGKFIGWRPSTLMSTLLTKAATRRTVA